MWHQSSRAVSLVVYLLITLTRISYGQGDSNVVVVGNGTTTTTTTTNVTATPAPVPEKPLKYCQSYGDPHYRTFDQTSYDFFGIGEFVMLQTNDSLVDIQVRLKKTGRASVNEHVIIRFANESVLFNSTVIVDRGNATLIPNITTARDYRPPLQPYPLYTGSNRMNVTYNTTTKWFNVTWGEWLVRVRDIGSAVNIHVTLPRHAENTTSGLCGDSNSWRDDDLKPRWLDAVIDIKNSKTPKCDIMQKYGMSYFSRESESLFSEYQGNEDFECIEEEHRPPVFADDDDDGDDGNDNGDGKGKKKSKIKRKDAERACKRLKNEPDYYDACLMDVAVTDDIQYAQASEEAAINAPDAVLIPVDDDDDDNGWPWWIYVAVGAGFILVIVVIVIAVMKSRKKTQSAYGETRVVDVEAPVYFVYTPDPTDAFDCQLAQTLNKLQLPLESRVKKVVKGSYILGVKKVQIVQRNGNMIARTGGGYMDIPELLRKVEGYVKG